MSRSENSKRNRLREDLDGEFELEQKKTLLQIEGENEDQLLSELSFIIEEGCINELDFSSSGVALLEV